jgi:(+)-trans-carveol dehydrogenase
MSSVEVTTPLTTRGRLEKKVVFITGAARGQGRSHAVRLAEEGADIIAVDVCGPIKTSFAPPSSPEDLLETSRLVTSLGRRICTYEVDVRDVHGLASAVSAGVAALGRLDVIVANAGMISMAPLLEVTSEQWQEMLDVNLSGVWHTVKAGVPHVIAGGNGGSIILISSGAGLKGYRNLGHYGAAKHGVVGLGRTLAAELATEMIRVNVVCPGFVNTRMNDNAQWRAFSAPDLDEPTWEEAAARHRDHQLLQVPWMEPIEISNAVLWLASDESASVTGVVLPVDLGVMAN